MGFALVSLYWPISVPTEGSGWQGRPSGREISDDLWLLGTCSCQKVGDGCERGVCHSSISRTGGVVLHSPSRSGLPASRIAPVQGLQGYRCRTKKKKKICQGWLHVSTVSLAQETLWPQEGRACWGSFAACSTSHFSFRHLLWAATGDRILG